MERELLRYLALGIFIIFLSLFSNVVLHEIGHFFVADMLDMNPSIHLESPISITGHHVSSNRFAYVSYSSYFPGVALQDVLIAAAGPIVNAIMALICAGLLFVNYKNKTASYILLLFLVVSVLSCVINLIPLSGSDGSVIFSYLMR